MKRITKISIAIGLSFLTPVFASAATLNLSPSTQSVNQNDIFTLDINLNTQGQAIDGVDILYLNYNPSMLEVQDSVSGTSGIQIQPGTLMANTLLNSVNTATGEVSFSQAPGGGVTYNGSGTLAKITFKALTTGTANVTFNFISGDTTDTNIASNGADILTGVTNGSYTITVAPTNTGGGGGGGGGGSSGGGGGGSSSSGSSSGSGSGSSSSSGSTGGQGTQTTTNTGTYSGSKIASNVALGARGSDVIALQNFLVAKGFLTADNATGYFGYATQAAVQALQKSLGIVSSGSPDTTGYGAVGPTTRARINALIGVGGTNTTGTVNTVSTVSVGGSQISKNVALGARGSDVIALQNFLVAKGFLTADNATGYFGYATQAAVQALQKSLGIVSSGSPDTTGYGAVGPTTRARINALIGTANVNTSGTQNVTAPANLQSQVDAVQKQIIELLKKLQSSQ